jgi:hypothetical protein
MVQRQHLVDIRSRSSSGVRVQERCTHVDVGAVGCGEM